MGSLRPFVILAIRLMGPGRRRIEMVKLAHQLNGAQGDEPQLQGRLHVALDRQAQALSSQQRAA